VRFEKWIMIGTEVSWCTLPVNRGVEHATIPWAQSGGIATYRATLERLSQALDIATIVPGHAGITTGAAITTYKQYLDDIQASAKRAVADGVSFDAFVSQAKIPARFRIATPLVPLMTGFHRWNLQRAYRETKP